MVDLLAPSGMLLLRYARLYAACMSRLQLPNQAQHVTQRALFSAEAARWVMMDAADDAGINYADLDRERVKLSAFELEELRSRVLEHASWGVERWAIQRVGRVMLQAQRDLSGATLEKRLLGWQSAAYGQWSPPHAVRSEANAAVITIALARPSSSVSTSISEDLRRLALASLG